MDKEIENCIETWKKNLLDYSKRNRLYKFCPTKRTNLEITSPEYGELYNRLVKNYESLIFPFPEDVDEDDEDEDDVGYSVFDADITTTVKSLKDQQMSLYVLRKKAKVEFEERGINVLHLILGLFRWKPQSEADEEILSPLILVPVQLSCRNLASPYELSFLQREDVELNPTLQHKLLSDHNVSLFDSDVNLNKLENLDDYLDLIERKVANLGTVERVVHLTSLSFLKMNMYEDLDKNRDRLSANPHIRRLCGAPISEVVEDPLVPDNFDHDNETRPLDVFHILDADSSQMDAILAAKRGASFVLQGPPGTGKSQTIANIISSTLADEKKVLFVSEKKAALDVVYKRLKNAGLGDFCFALHDHKVNREQILHELQKRMDEASRRLPAPDIKALNELQRKRQELNHYHNDLHTPCSGYNKSVYDMIGRLAKLSEVPDVVFDMPDVDQLTEGDITDRCDLLKRLAVVMGKRSEDDEHNCWWHATVETYTQELRLNIDAHLVPLIPKLRKLKETLSTFHSRHGNNIAYTVHNLPVHEEVLHIVAESPGIPAHWVGGDSSILELRERSSQLENLIADIKQRQKELESSYSQDFFDIQEAAEYYKYLKESESYLSSFFKEKDIDVLVENIDNLVQEVASIKESLDSLDEAASFLAVELGVDKPRTRKELQKFVEMCGTLNQMPAIPGTWFDMAIFAQVEQEVPRYRDIHERVRSLEKQVLQNFDSGIFDIDYKNFMRRFRMEYGSFLKLFKLSYHKDKKSIKAYWRKGTTLKDKDIHNLFNSLKDREDLLKDIEASSEQLRRYYGIYYEGICSEWKRIEEMVNNFRKIVNIIPSIPGSLRELLQSGHIPTDSVASFLELWHSVVSDKLYTRIKEICEDPIELDKEYSIYSEHYGQIIDSVYHFIDFYSGIVRLRNIPAPFSQIVQDIVTLQSYIEYMRKLDKDQVSLAHDYGFYYRGLETDWNSIHAALDYSERLKAVVKKYNLSSQFIENISSDTQLTQRCGALLEEIKTLQDEMADDLRWYMNMFSSDIQNLLYDLDLSVLANRVEKCQLNKHLLEEWIDCQVQRQRCSAAGLTDYVQQIEDNKISVEYIVSAYLKRFYVLWIDAIVKQFPELEKFSGVIHEDLIKKFQELDVRQLKIAPQRIRKNLCDHLPDFGMSHSRNSEVGILKREIEKKSHRKTLRRLFAEIPNLITGLKPCFMMSPLSVSVFLESESYNFDLVIFDEASQVHTEDAVGAIMRGKQVIIVGDDKQLPPTDFFRAMTSEEDFEDEDLEEDDDKASFGSILSAARGRGFRKQTLKWHYRSRYENLIAFSNEKFYDRSLITFPSTMENAPDCGVEFVYVPDGCYERKKRTNSREAQKVADLVFGHFCKYGKERSIGVVAFSEAQQGAIEDAIIKRRRRDDRYESYFNEDGREAFFIKNLENVQGDERDTIIFSVGYAKDLTGKMYMNFGPLSRQGGERRLNVAVTRAKYNVKLVASILPTDLDLNKTHAEGVKLLRSYLEFAQQGKLPSNPQSIESESPFEEAVYDYLSTRGYRVQTQVGCSRYRIDMAVEHPSLKGKFAIGIECDGATYHSSRTARERDRLRQTILEDMGWTIYRIWSTDWIKSPERQGAKLEEAIHQAFERCLNEQTQTVNAEEKEKADAENFKLVVIDPRQPELGFTESASEPSGCFVPYEYTKIDPSWTYKDRIAVIGQIIKIEQPIHIHELSKRLMPLYDRQKVTASFCSEIEQDLLNLPPSYKIRRVGEFLQFPNFKTERVRISIIGIPDRDVAYIPEEEIELAFIEIVREVYGIPKDELFRIIANKFGFVKIGRKIKEAFERVYQNALLQQKIKEVDGKVSI